MPGSRFTLVPSSLSDALVESLRERILSGEIAAGERIPEQRIVDEYGVARPTAKDSLNRLAFFGILRRTPRHSAIVPVFDASEIEDLYFTREILESGAVTHLADHADLADRIIDAQSAMSQAAGDRDIDAWVRLEAEFHQALIHDVHSDHLARTYELITGEANLSLRRFPALHDSELTTAVDEHDAIIQAIRAADAHLARTALTEHLTAELRRILARLPEPKEDDGR